MSSRNSNIDLLKIILAILVIAIHVFPSTGVAGALGIAYYYMANSIARIAVPLFFILSGYFLGNNMQKAVAFKTVKRILILFLVWQIIYFPFFYQDLPADQITFKRITFTLIYGYLHLWYLSSYIVGILLLLLEQKWIKSPPIQLAFAIVLYLIGYSFQLWMGLTPDWYVYDISQIYEYIGSPRNGIFMGLPMLIIGTQYSYWKRFVPNIFFLGGFLVLFGVEVGLYKAMLQRNMDFYLSVLPIAMFLLSYSVTRPSIKMMSINKNMSLGIYLIHPIIVYYANLWGWLI